jgi:hypothetical protein
MRIRGLIRRRESPWIKHEPPIWKQFSRKIRNCVAPWEDASVYRNSFATPDEARTATTALADLDRMDALFFSGRREDHAALARAVAALDPAAFKSLAEAMSQIVAAGQGIARSTAAAHDSNRNQPPALSSAVATQTPPI